MVLWYIVSSILAHFTALLYNKVEYFGGTLKLYTFLRLCVDHVSNKSLTSVILRFSNRLRISVEPYCVATRKPNCA